MSQAQQTARTLRLIVMQKPALTHRRKQSDYSFIILNFKAVSQILRISTQTTPVF